SLRRPVKKIGPYISISRQFGSGGMAISKRVAEKLGWQHFDREIIEAIANRTHARGELVAKFDEHIQNELQTYLYNLFTKQMLNNTQYLHHLTQVLLGIAQFGEAVIVGRGANFILPPEAGLRVRIIAPIAFRQQQLVQVCGYSEKQAARKIAQQDEEQRAFFQHHFRCQPDDPCAYDVILNTSSINLNTAVEVILQLAQAKLQISVKPDQTL
ncbi:MAG: cytidylate kinase-like family protein, partial [candidate division KSB1 bacterium]|nr:cytidylate kinase-like family protein [candidate division KSB1 bacterium]